MTFSLVATDLDGTLLREDQTISPRTRAALTRAGSAGARHVIVTGRAVTWARPIFDALGYKGLAVCAQGAQVYDVGEDRLLTSVTLDRSQARRAALRLREQLGEGLRLAISRAGVDGAVLVEDGYHYNPELPIRAIHDDAELWTEPLLKLYIQHPTHTDDELTALAREVCAGLVDVTHAGPGIVELLPVGLGKSVGLSLAARRLGLKAADTVAFGDMPNDVTMLKWAGHGVAMGNAHAEVVAVADEVTATNEEDGIAIVLERLYPDD